MFITVFTVIKLFVSYSVHTVLFCLYWSDTGTIHFVNYSISKFEKFVYSFETDSVAVFAGYESILLPSQSKGS